MPAPTPSLLSPGDVTLLRNYLASVDTWDEVSLYFQDLLDSHQASLRAARPRPRPMPSEDLSSTSLLFDFPALSQEGAALSHLAAAVRPLSAALVSLDPGLGLAELLLALLLGGALYQLVPELRPAAVHADLVALCQLTGLSLAELVVPALGLLGLLTLDLVGAATEDDTADALAGALVSLTAGTAAGLAAASLLQTGAIFAHLGGAALTRALLADLLNTALGLFRVSFCFIRYLFYDLQSEVMDLAFHGADLEGWDWLAHSLPVLLLGLFTDLATWLIQGLLALAKLGLALYLFWLVIDTFLLRPLATLESRRAWLE